KGRVPGARPFAWRAQVAVEAEEALPVLDGRRSRDAERPGPSRDPAFLAAGRGRPGGSDRPTATGVRYCFGRSSDLRPPSRPPLRPGPGTSPSPRAPVVARTHSPAPCT